MTKNTTYSKVRISTERAKVLRGDHREDEMVKGKYQEAVGL